MCKQSVSHFVAQPSAAALDRGRSMHQRWQEAGRERESVRQNVNERAHGMDGGLPQFRPASGA